MSKQIKAAAVQFTIKVGDIDANVEHVREALHRLHGEGVQLAVLPEMWSCGFAYRELNELARRTPEVVEEMGRLSAELGMVLVGSLPEPEGDKVCNTAYVLDQGKLVGKYRKIHLFSLMNEDRAFTGGESWLLADTSLGKIGVIICYDLRFPELTRRLGGGRGRDHRRPRRMAEAAAGTLAAAPSGEGNRKPALYCCSQRLRGDGKAGLLRRQHDHRPQGRDPRRRWL